MKQTIFAALIMVALASCGDSGNTNSGRADSTNTGSGMMTDTSIGNKSSSAMMDTTGTTGHSDSVASGSPTQVQGTPLDTQNRSNKKLKR